MTTMNRALVMALAALLAPVAGFAATKPCEELKAEIETKIQAAGVTSYTLEIVAKAEVKDPNMVVGTCDGGKRRIIYQKNDS